MYLLLSCAILAVICILSSSWVFENTKYSAGSVESCTFLLGLLLFSPLHSLHMLLRSRIQVVILVSYGAFKARSLIEIIKIHTLTGLVIILSNLLRMICILMNIKKKKYYMKNESILPFLLIHSFPTGKVGQKDGEITDVP